MRVSSGWNTAFGRDKFDILLEAEDLKLMLAEHGIDPARADPGREDSLTSTTVFRLMLLESRYFSLTVLVQQLRKPGQAEEDQRRLPNEERELDAVKGARADLLDAIRVGKVK